MGWGYTASSTPNLDLDLALWDPKTPATRGLISLTNCGPHLASTRRTWPVLTLAHVLPVASTGSPNFALGSPYLRKSRRTTLTPLTTLNSYCTQQADEKFERRGPKQAKQAHVAEKIAGFWKELAPGPWTIPVPRGVPIIIMRPGTNYGAGPYLAAVPTLLETMEASQTLDWVWPGRLYQLITVMVSFAPYRSRTVPLRGPFMILHLKSLKGSFFAYRAARGEIDKFYCPSEQERTPYLAKTLLERSVESEVETVEGVPCHHRAGRHYNRCGVVIPGTTCAIGDSMERVGSCCWPYCFCYSGQRTIAPDTSYNSHRTSASA